MYVIFIKLFQASCIDIGLSQYSTTSLIAIFHQIVTICILVAIFGTVDVIFQYLQVNKSHKELLDGVGCEEG